MKGIVFKDWFKGGGGKEGEGAFEIDDLMALERYEEAEKQLQAKIGANANDLHAHLKLGDLYIRMLNQGKAVEEYIFVAEEYAQDGFYDKGIALLSKVRKLLPEDKALPRKIDKLKEAKALEHKRMLAIEGLLERRGAGGQKAGTSAFELQRLWHNMASCPLVARLDGEQLKRLFGAMELHRLEEGATLAEQREERPEMFLIAEGVIEVQLQSRYEEPKVLRSFGPGDLVGEGALLEHKPWPATYRAGQPSAVLRLDRQGLEQALVGNPDPRSFLAVLREEGNDQLVRTAIEKLRGGTA